MNRLSHFLVLLALASLIFSSCDQQSASLPTWMEGTWETGDTLGFTVEKWEVINKEFMSGEGLFLMKDGTTIVEILSIFIRDGVLFYTAILPNQNNGKEIMFIDTHKNPDSLVFENPSHDYPKKIVYHKQSLTKIDVFIYGEDENPNKITINKTEE